MSVTGNWVTPRLNGLKYFEKPPLQYWITAGAYRLFGIHEWTARLWPAAAGLLAVLAIGIAGHALGGVALGTFAALALAGTLWHAGMAQIVSLDSGLAFFLTLAFAGLVIAQRPGTGADTRRRWMLIAWAAMAGATLSKGPDRHRAAAGRARRLFAHQSRCRDPETPAPHVRPAALSRPHRTVVHRGDARQRRVPAVLLRARALRAISHRGAPAHGSVVVLHPAGGRRQPAVARRARFRRAPAVARRRRREGHVLVAAPGARVGGVRLRVLQPLRVEASLVHPADVRAARPRGR